MANLPETPVWETGIYQLEETDPVQGGPNGIDNQQGKQLANRTAWLKSQVETLGTGKQPLDATLTAIAALNGVADRIAYFTGPDKVDLTPLTAFIRTLLDDGDASAARSTLGAISQAQLDAAISALVNSSPATLDTLNELAAALGNDANFAATVTNALAAKAPLASPVFTGDPNAPTPAKFDNDTSLATTEFVQRALGNRQGYHVPATGSSFSAADAGKAFGLNGPSTYTLSSASGLPNGATFDFFAAGNGCVVQASGSDTITIKGGTTVTSLTLNSGDTLSLVRVGPTAWLAISGSAQLKFAEVFGSSLAANGYQRLPSGLIIQWGIASIPGNNVATAVGLPIAWPTSFLEAAASIAGSGFSSAVIGIEPHGTLPTSYINLYNASPSGTQAVRWIAIGY